MTSDTRLANPGVRFPPPFLFLVGLALAWYLETRVTRIRLIGGTATTAGLETIGAAIILAGLLIVFWGMVTFVRARTAILPMRPASRIVQTGPYRFSRNPMYSGGAVAYFGGALAMNSGWAIILFPFVMYSLYRLVISKEERYLAASFPEDYDAYRKRVRRWI